MVCLDDMSRREKSHSSIHKYTITDPESMLQAKKVLSWSYELYNELKAVKIRAGLWQMYEWVWICSESECWKVILILKLKSFCEKCGYCFEVRTLVAIPKILAPWWEIEEDKC